jgi:hypothetical protein
VVIDAGVHQVAGCGGSGKDLVAAEVMAGERGADVDVLDGEVVVRRSQAVIHRFVPCLSSPFVEHYVARRAHTLCPWVNNVVGLQPSA